MTGSWSNICRDTESTLDPMSASWTGWPASTTSGSPRSTPHNRRKALASGTHALCAAEHFTGVLGHWALNNSWDDMGVDPTLADLYRWHGAEEVEHRHVSYNVAKYFGMDYFAQAASGALVTVSSSSR